MNYKPLGKTGLHASSLGLGTVALGLTYGIQQPVGNDQPSETEAIRVIQETADAGVNLFDTAPTYGNGESIIGKALANLHECYVATKVSIPKNSEGNILSGKGAVEL